MKLSNIFFRRSRFYMYVTFQGKSGKLFLSSFYYIERLLQQKIAKAKAGYFPEMKGRE